MSDRSKDLLEAVDKLQPAMVDFTRELVSIPTENPPGSEYARCAAVIAGKLKEIGLEPQVVEVSAPNPGDPPGYYVTACYGEGERALHFHGHYDVVPRSVEGQFDPVIQRSNLFGRGSSDMKGGSPRWFMLSKPFGARGRVSMGALN